MGSSDVVASVEQA